MVRTYLARIWYFLAQKPASLRNSDVFSVLEKANSYDKCPQTLIYYAKPYRKPNRLTFRDYPNNRLVMTPSENLSAYGGVPPLGVLRKESLGLRRGLGGRPKMLGRQQASLARRGLLHVDPVR